MHPARRSRRRNALLCCACLLLGCRVHLGRGRLKRSRSNLGSNRNHLCLCGRRGSGWQNLRSGQHTLGRGQAANLHPGRRCSGHSRLLRSHLRRSCLHSPGTLGSILRGHNRERLSGAKRRFSIHGCMLVKIKDFGPQSLLWLGTCTARASRRGSNRSAAGGVGCLGLLWRDRAARYRRQRRQQTGNATGVRRYARASARRSRCSGNVGNQRHARQPVQLACHPHG